MDISSASAITPACPPTPPRNLPVSSPSAFVRVVPSQARNQTLPVSLQPPADSAATTIAHIPDATLRAMSRDAGAPALICHVMKTLGDSGVAPHDPAVGPLLRDTLQALGEDARLLQPAMTEEQARVYINTLTILLAAVREAPNDFPGRNAFLEGSDRCLLVLGQSLLPINRVVVAHAWINWQTSALVQARDAALHGLAPEYPALWESFALESPGKATREVRENLWRLAIEGPLVPACGWISPMAYDGALIHRLRAGDDAAQVLLAFRISDPALVRWVLDSAPAYAAAGPAAAPLTIEQAQALFHQPGAPPAGVP